MASYNRINGTYVVESRWLLTDLLRDTWGFDGVVVSDWGAVQFIGRNAPNRGSTRGAHIGVVNSTCRGEASEHQPCQRG